MLRTTTCEQASTKNWDVPLRNRCFQGKHGPTLCKKHQLYIREAWMLEMCPAVFCFVFVFNLLGDDRFLGMVILNCGDVTMPPLEYCRIGARALLGWRFTVTAFQIWGSMDSDG